MFEKFNESARRAIFFSRYEASRVGQHLIDSEHVLLGLLRESDAVTTELWRAFSLAPNDIQAKYPTVETQISSSAELPISEDVKKILAYALQEAETREDVEVAPCHLVLAILRVPDCEAAVLLTQYGIEYDLVSEIARVLTQEIKKRAEIEERTPITLRQSHYELFDQLAESMNLRERRSSNRQALVLALIDAIVASRVCESRYSSVEELRTRLERAIAQGLPGT